MDSLLPSWLSSVLCGQDAVIAGFSAKLANMRSNTSRLFEVTVDYKNTKTEYFIVKLFGSSANNEKNFVSYFDFASKEPIIYRDYLPIVNEKVNYKFGPDDFTSSINNGIILKDLTKAKYVVGDKAKQLDLTQCARVIVTLAKFHAASVACHRDNPRLVETVGQEVVYVAGGPIEQELKLKHNLEHSLKLFVNLLSTINAPQELIDLISNRFSNLFKSTIECCQPRLHGLNVLNHGDLWTNNILFQYAANGEIDDVKFIDYQLCRWTSPVIDLLFFIWTSANEDVRAGKQQELFNIYLETLNNTLEALGCPERMSSSQLSEEVASAVDWVLGTIALTLPVIIADDNCVDHKNLYQGKNFRKVIPSIIEHFLLQYNSSKSTATD